MSSEIENIVCFIRKNFVKLSENLNIVDLLKKLHEAGLLCYVDYDSLSSKSRVEQNIEFLLNMDMYGEGVGKFFLAWLESTHKAFFDNLNKASVASASGLSPEQFEIVEKDQNLIRKQFVLLLKRINANAIAPFLFQDGFFSRDDLEKIFVLKTRRERANAFLTQIIGRVRSSQIRLGIFSSFTRGLQIYQPELFEEFISKSFDVTLEGEKSANKSD